MSTNVTKRILAIAVAFFMVFSTIPSFSYATDSAEPAASSAAKEIAEIEGISISYDGVWDEENSSDTEYWFTACDESKEETSQTKVYITNTNEEDGYLTFNYKVGALGYADNDFGSVTSNDGYINSFGNLYIDSCGEIVYPGSDDKVVLESGSTLEITVTSGKSELYDFSVFALDTASLKFQKIYTKAEVTFAAATNGSYTVDGADKEGETVEVKKNNDETWPSLKLVATPAEGYQFLQWVDGNGEFISSETEYDLVPSNGNMTIKPVFASESDAQFKVGSMKYDSWDAAMEASESGSDKVVTLMNNAALPARSAAYEIPAGVTFVVPFDEAGTVYTTEPTCITDEDWVKPSAFRTLTLESGAKIEVNGQLSVPAPHTPIRTSNGNSGSPHRAYGEIAMKDGSNITINSGGAIYAYGYITGEGAVEAKSGATVYEYFQIMDFKGGTATTYLLQGGYIDEETGKSVFCNIFPLSQYYIQNIEVPLTIDYGAQEYGYSSIYMGDQRISAPVGFIGNSADMMFKLQPNASITKYYDGAKDRLIAEVDGDMDISPMTISQYQYTVDSSDFVLPINSNITIKINSGKIDISQDIALLPGSELIIGEAATCNLLKNTDTGKLTNIYVYDRDQWVGKSYVSSYKKDLVPLNYAPSKTYTRTEADLVDAKIQVAGTLNALEGYVYTTDDTEDTAKGGANICGVEGGKILLQQGIAKETYQFRYVGAEAPHGDYDAIHITTAKLLNSDGKYTTPRYVSGKYTYINSAWKGECNHLFSIYDETKAADPTCEDNGYTGNQCEYCEEYETIPATGHDHEAVVTDPTCTDKGYTTFTCECGDTYTGNEVAALGHTEEVIPAVEAKCEETGLTEGKRCSACKETLVAQEIVNATGHSYSSEITVEATCTEDGIKTYTCSGCGDKYTETIPAAHKWEAIDKEATCTEPGASATCSVCGETTDVVEPLGHEWDDGVVQNTPTCTEDGEMLYTCTREGCGETKTEKIDATGHTYLTVAKKEATCTEAGHEEYKMCACGEIDPDTEFVEIPAGHKLVVIPAVPPTCTEDGTYEGWQCEACGEVTVTPLTWAKTGHSIVHVEKEEATCTKDGYEAHYKCETCNELYSSAAASDETKIEAPEVIESPGHQLEFPEELEASEPWCEIEGYTQGSKCTVCQKVFGHVEIPALEHEWTIVQAKDPTYSAKGWNEHEKCTRCKKKQGYEEYEQLGAYIDNFEEFADSLETLEEWAQDYIKKNPGKDPLNLVIKYIRTGVDRYNSFSWDAMAGKEDEGFAAYVAQREDEYNTAAATEGKKLIKVTGLKDIKEFTLPNGDNSDVGHMFGTMDLTYHNNFRLDNADVGGWAGDIVDLLSLADFCGTGGYSTVDGMADYIKTMYLGKTRAQLAEEGLVPNADEDEDDNIVEGHYNEGVFSQEDIYGDLDAYYIMDQLKDVEYEGGDLSDIVNSYFTKDLSMEKRAAYLIDDRLNDATLRTDLRNEVYAAYTANSAITTLEGTRNWKNKDLMDLRKAACYAFADYICECGGDYVAELENDFYKVVSAERSTLAPGITQTKYKSTTTVDNKNMAYYIATCDVTRDDVQVCANYSTRPVAKNEDGSYKWGLLNVVDQAKNAQKAYGDPESKDYIPNYNVIASINAGGFDMEDGTPGGLLVMDGIEYYPVDNEGFFGILEDGSAIIGNKADYERLQAEGKVKEAIGGFGTKLVSNGKIAVTRSENYYTSRASRTAVGITKTGKVVFMVLDGRMGGDEIDSSCGGSAEEIAQIMLDAGCVEAINLDGGGSSTYVSREEGTEGLALVNKPSDGRPREISTSLFVASTAPSSTEFDHAVIDSEYSYLTKGTSITLTASAVSATNNVVEMPEGVTWAVSSSAGKITQDGVFTANQLGDVEVKLMLDGETVGHKTIHIVEPNNLYYSKTRINTVHGQDFELPIKAVYNNKAVAINEKDIEFELSDDRAGKINGFIFTPAESELKSVKIIASLPNSDATVTLTAYMFRPDEASFDFDNATGGDEQLSWKRTVSDDFTTEYTFGIDMSKVEVPEKLETLTYMLPGGTDEDASAWSFLCNLAERISSLTYVKAQIKFDEDVNVDISNLNMLNEYFTLDKDETVIDEETNTVTLTLRWIKQSKMIDIDLANPVCILSGIKLTVKDDAAWSDDRLQIINSGEISYRVCMRATSLYSFSKKPENQKEYGLVDYSNPADSYDSGGAFESVYNTFKDTYTLDRSVKDGWVTGDGGLRYYENGVMYTGINKIGDKYYNFNENTGVLIQYPDNVGNDDYYTGEYFNNGKEYYIREGVIYTGDDGNNGWMMMGDRTFRYYNPNKGGEREEVTANEVKSTCIVDGYCDYTSASGATYRQLYDDAGGHEYANEAGDSPVCTVCGWQRFDLSACDPKINRTDVTYTGEPIKVYGTFTNPKLGTKLSTSGEIVEIKRDENVGEEGNKGYVNNTEVGVASVTYRATKVAMYTNINQWRGNYRGYHTLYFTIHPAAPANVKYSINSKNVATVTWDKALGAEEYLVQYSTNGGKKWTNAGTVTTNKYTKTLNKKYSYMFRVLAAAEGLDKDGKSATFYSIKTPVAQLKAPTGIKTTNVLSSGKPKVSWTAVKGADKYTVYVSKSSKAGTHIRTITTTNNYATDTKAVAGTKYYYRVKAVYSKNTSASSIQSDYMSRLCDLSRPTGVKVINLASTGKPKVSWKSVKGAGKYKVYISKTGKAGTFTRVITTSKTYATDTKAVAGKKYYYKVAAVYTKNTSANSAQTSSIKKTCKLARPSIKLSNKTKGQIKVSWKKVTGASSYNVYSKAPGGKWKLVKKTTSRSFIHKNGLKKGKTYQYRVKAVKKNNSAATSAYSLIKKAKRR